MILIVNIVMDLKTAFIKNPLQLIKKDLSMVVVIYDKNWSYGWRFNWQEHGVADTAEAWVLYYFKR